MATQGTTPSSIRWTIRPKSDVKDFRGRVLLIPCSSETEKAILAGARSKIDLWKTSRRPLTPTPQSKDDGDEDDQTHFPSGGPDYMTLEQNLPKHPVVVIQELSKGQEFYCGSSHRSHLTLADPDIPEFCYVHLQHFIFRQSYDDLNGHVDLVNFSSSEFSFIFDGHQTNIDSGSVHRLSEGEQEATLGDGLHFLIVVNPGPRSTSSSPVSQDPSEIQPRERIEDGPEKSSKKPEALVKNMKEQGPSRANPKKHRRTNTDVDSKQSPKSMPGTSPQTKRARQAGDDQVVIHKTSASRVIRTGDRTALRAVKQVTGEESRQRWALEKDILRIMSHVSGSFRIEIPF